jgi:5-(carboxyamino)imidazole ribonucleotide synthase
MGKTLNLRADYVIGFLGAGQLAKMSAQEAFRYGWRVASYSDRPAAEPLQWMSPLSHTGSFEDVDALVAFAETCDVITLENEFLSSEVLHQVVERTGVPIYPSPASFEAVESKWKEKSTFQAAGIPVAPFEIVSSSQDFVTFGETHGWPFVLKSSKGGYDGYGNRVVSSLEEAQEGFRSLGGDAGDAGHEIIAEAMVPFVKELAVQVARNELGMVVYPCCETIQTGQICTAVLAPAPVEASIQSKAQELAMAAMEAIDGVGLFAFEFFLTDSGDLLLNESAPRPHNSGHYTIEACESSQFDNHVRAVTSTPLGSTAMKVPAAVMINILGTDERPAMLDGAVELLEHNAKLHLYGKAQSKPGRKMGHLTLLGEDVDVLYKKGRSWVDGLRL